MKKILIYDVAAEKTGAAAVLKQYYNRYANDNSCETIIVTSLMDFPNNEHTHIVKLPWVKKSKFHRLFCDNVYIHRLVKKYNCDEVINLQCISVRGLRIPQVVYMHNAIPISDVEFDFRNERSLWFFKHIIGKMIMKNLKYADKIIVQADWIKKELHEKYGINNTLIEVERVKPLFNLGNSRIKTKKNIFFYPANYCSYKNHQCIIDACVMLKQEGIYDYEVVFTIDDDVETQNISKQVINEIIPVEMVGLLNKEEMEEYYRKSILVFPSFLETVGLPLIEAQMFSSEILAVDLPYAREAVGNYSRVKWFNYKDPYSLFLLMKHIIESN